MSVRSVCGRLAVACDCLLAGFVGLASGQEAVTEHGPDSLNSEPSRAITRLVDELKKHPVKPSTGPDRVGLYLMDVSSGDVTLIADTPEVGLTQCGSPAWSNDGKIYFDATPGTQWNQTRLKVISLKDGKLSVTDLGPGNCPAPSPSGDRLLFLQNPGPVPPADVGVWLMQADGSERRKLGGYGRPFWSPDAHQFLVVSFSLPREVTVIDDRPGHKSGVLKIPDNHIYTMPAWAGAETLTAVIGEDEPDTIAMLDVSDPQDGRIKKVLWTRPAGQDLKLNYPVLLNGRGSCAFVGSDAKGAAIYLINPDEKDPPKRIGRDGDDKLIAGLVPSPDGRYLLFSSDRTTVQEHKPEPAR